MGIARMKYLNVYGPERMLETALGAIADCSLFMPESDEAIHSGLDASVNRYEPQLTKAKGLLKDLGASSLAADFIGRADSFSFGEVESYLETFAGQVAARSKHKTDIENELEKQQKAEHLLSHMLDMSIDFDELFSVEYLKVRVGRLPKNSYLRLKYYAEKGFNFTSYFNYTIFDFDGEYYWGIYFAPRDSVKEIDDIFASLYFERLWVPDSVHGKPEEAMKLARSRQEELQKELQELVTPGGIAADEELTTIQNMASWLAYMNQIFEMRRYALVFNHTFYIAGFVPADEMKQFETVVESLGTVHIKEADDREELPVTPPTKLKNNFFNRPFQMFTEMYGLPGYREIDPTPMVGVIYSVLYGLMFADFGQGIALALVGYFIMYRMKGMEIGRILVRAAIFSCLFGLLFGSVFGFEELLDPVYDGLGLHALPFHVMDADSVMLILMVSLGIGIVVVALAIFTNIVSCIRAKDWGGALTGPNGLSGLIFYLAVVLLVLDMMLLSLGLSGKLWFILPFVVLPLVVMYFAEPLSELLNGHKPHYDKLSDLFVNSFFELFVSILEYLSNTVSFLRVGGFVLAHAGMMLVVMTLANMSSGVAYWAIVVIGNIVVIALEGLIVGIQALRLNYYEVFSRFYNPDGRPFTPLCIQSDTVEL